MSPMNRWFFLPLTLIAAPAFARDDCPAETVANVWEAAPLLDLQAVGGEEGSALKPGPTGDRPLRHVWVIDHSGSMYADYSPGSPREKRPYYVQVPAFHAFVGGELAANFRDGKDSAAIIAFNEYAYGWDGREATKIDEGSGPTFVDLQVGSKAELSERLSKLPPPPYGSSTAGFPAPKGKADNCGAPGAASNCSKMLEGLEAARTLLDADTGDGVIWLVTDNIYEGGAGSDGLSQAEMDENRAFYEALKSTPEYRVVVAYPIVHGASGAWLGGTSLFVYGIYYDRDTTRTPPVEEVRRLLGDASDGVLASDGLTKTMAGYTSAGSPSPGRPFRFKPLDQDVVRISLAADVEQVKKHVEMGDKVKLKAKVRVQNLLDHRVIDSVTFQVTNAKWAGYEPNTQATKGTGMPSINTVCAGTFVSEPVTVTGIAPGQSVDVEVPLEMPPVAYEIGSTNDLMQIAFNDYVVMGGALRARLTDVTSHLSIDPTSFRGTYGAASLPEVFKNPQVGQYTAQFVGKTRNIENPGTVMALLGMGAAAIGVALMALGGFMLTSVSRRLLIDGADRGAISIPRLRGVPIKRGAETLGSASLSLGGVIQLRGTNGYVARREGPSWNITKEHGPSMRVELRSTRRTGST